MLSVLLIWLHSGLYESILIFVHTEQPNANNTNNESILYPRQNRWKLFPVKCIDRRKITHSRVLCTLIKSNKTEKQTNPKTVEKYHKSIHKPSEWCTDLAHICRNKWKAKRKLIYQTQEVFFYYYWISDFIVSYSTVPSDAPGAHRNLLRTPFPIQILYTVFGSIQCSFMRSRCSPRRRCSGIEP